MIGIVIPERQKRGAGLLCEALEIAVSSLHFPRPLPPTFTKTRNEVFVLTGISIRVLIERWFSTCHDSSIVVPVVIISPTDPPLCPWIPPLCAKALSR